MKMIKLIIAIIGVGLLMIGCKKSYLDISTNPNSLTSSTPDVIFTGAVARTAAIITPNETGEYWSGHWTQSSTYIYDPARFSYNFNNTNFNFWDTWYDVLEDFQYAIDNAVSKGLPQFRGPSKVMKAYIFQQVVDCYGNAPYSDAFKGIGSITPKFDDQKAIYDSLIVLLDGAITDLKAYPFTGTTGLSDIVFKGNITSWVRFANSLKLRILIRQSRVASRQAYVIAEINKAAATTEGFLQPSQDVKTNPGYTQASGQTNPIYNNWGYTAAGAAQAIARFPRPTKFLFDQLIAKGDTFRLKRLAYAKGGESSTVDGKSAFAIVSGSYDYTKDIIANYVGVPYGSTSGYLAQNTSYIGPCFITKSGFAKDVYLMLAAESFFCLAEAKQTLPGVNLPGTAKSYYEQGVREAFKVTGTNRANFTVTLADGSTLLPNPDPSADSTILRNGKLLSDWSAATTATEQLQTIWFQKWLALTNFAGLEAWCDFRRTNYPAIPPSAGAPVGQALPVRLFYPNSEQASNSANVSAQGNIDVFTGKLFWDID
ncbi:MAG TPA: SusD/RagB family nutrient-binding outer membrane lipoprotein [Chitinophagaceae bacterium]|nr:SusD/RagB family nutrient-binding outer membrane lipoprotein [Chitinophagaceae bacterium]